MPPTFWRVSGSEKKMTEARLTREKMAPAMMGEMTLKG